MSAGLLDWPAAVITTGTALPVGVPGLTTTFTWYNPTNPGVSPAKMKSVPIPPMVVVTGNTVEESEVSGAD